jgi:uncharacterized membrane protein YedE/YeeE
LTAEHLNGLAGGVLIGLAATLLLWTHGRIAGVSGIAGALVGPRTERSWRVLFLVGLVVAGLMYQTIAGPVFETSISRSLPVVVAAGFLVGYGTRMGHGCTSGHGVCGLARRSSRSLIATVTFILTGVVTVWLVRTVWGGTL